MSEVRALIETLVARGLEPVEAAEIVTRAAIAGVAEAGRSAAAVKQQRYRDRNKASQTVTRDAIGDENSLPSQENPQTPKETQPSLPTTPKEKTPKGVQKKAVRLPSDWTLPEGWGADAIAMGLPAHLIDLEAAKMRDWSLSAKGGTKLDWRAAWRNWCRNAAGARASPSQAPSMADVFQFVGQRQGDERQPEDFGSDGALVPYLSVAGQRRQ